MRALPSKDPKLLHVYVKGAPETIKKLCIPETSEWLCKKPFRRPFTKFLPAVPSDFLEVLASLTQQGYRVLALAHKAMHLPWHKAERVQR